MEHVLSSCPVALKDGRYTWRHDQVLRVIAGALEAARTQDRHVQEKLRFINFCRAGEKKSSGEGKEKGLLSTAGDWQMVADLDRQLKFPGEIAATSRRPDVVLWSRSTKQVVLLELTVPWEERMEEAYERKLGKYQQLVEECQGNGWKPRCLPVEVGCRGFAGQSLWRAFRLLGITGQKRKKMVSEVCEEAERASRWVWLKREERWQC